MNVQSIRDLKDALKGDMPLSVCLRHALELAHLLNNKELLTWVRSEIDGYPPETESLPAYRNLGCHSYGDFRGDDRSMLKNAPIAVSQLPDFIQEFATKVRIHESIRTIEDVIEKSVDGLVQYPWPGDVVANVQRTLYRHASLMFACRTLHTSQLIAILETVRNRLLDFVLEIDKTLPKDARQATALSRATQSTVSDKVQTIIYAQYVVTDGSTNVVNNEMSGLINKQSNEWPKPPENEAKKGILSWLSVAWKWILSLARG